MKTGKSIQELAVELDRQNKVKKDFIASESRLAINENSELVMTNGSDHVLSTNRNFHAQVADRLGIPKKYYDRMQSEAPELLSKNTNHWFSNSSEKRMIRTLDGTARAFLSERYRPLDNYDLAQVVIPILTELGADVRSSEITESKFYLKAVIPGKVELIAPEGMDISGIKFDGSQRDKHIIVDHVEPGIVISNSEVGAGRLNVWPAIHTRECTNMASFRGDGFAKTHLGASLAGILEQGQHLAEFIQDDTRQARDEALWKELRDFCRASCEGDVFKTLVNRLRESRGAKIEGDVPKVVEVAADKFGWSGDEQSGILRHLIEGGELSQYGLHAAVTRFSQNVTDYDRASELEHVGADIIELPQREWKTLAVAA